MLEIKEEVISRMIQSYNMHTKQTSQITTLYYRLYVTYFEADQDLLKFINRNAFYRLNIYNGENVIAEMAQGINPVILAHKIFLNRAVLNFYSTTSNKVLKVKLMSRFGSKDVQLGEAQLDLQRINENYLQFTQRFNSLQSIQFSGEGGELKLIFNIFVQKSKVDLDLYIKKFKQNEREVLRAKRNLASKKKIEIQNSVDLKNQQNYQINRPQQKEDSSRKLGYRLEINQQPTSTSANNKQLAKPIQSNSNYLQINSDTKFNKKKLDSIQNHSKKLLNDFQQKQFQAYFTRMEALNNPKILTLDAGTISIISDGSEQSEMLNENLSLLYSERAVAHFKRKCFICLNIVVVVIVFILLYFLLAPTAKIQKKVKGRNRIKISDIAEEIIDI